jgi:16S rRNA (cytosine1402-N4)-methyltransferase
MRFDQTQGKTAADLVNNLSADELTEIFRTYGEEPKARAIALEIVAAREYSPIMTTIELAEIVESVKKQKRGNKIHPATLVFQALRIAVNDEWGAIKEFLPQAVNLLAPQGRLAVITFHSGEDRIVKQFFQAEAKGCICPPDFPVCRCGHEARIKLITKKPVEASDDEVKENPRSRSAKLRVIEKL